MMNTIKICLTLLFIDFALCVQQDGNIYHYKESDSEKFEYVFSVEKLPVNAAEFYESYGFKLYKAQGEKDIQPASTKSEVLAARAKFLEKKFESENDRIKLTVERATEESQPYKFKFSILKVEPKDAGIYTFEVTKFSASEEVIYSKKLIIYVHSKPTEVTFYGGNLNANFSSEDKNSHVMNFNEPEGQIFCEGLATGYRKNGIKWDVKVEIEGADNKKLFDPSKFDVDIKVDLEGPLVGMQVPKTSLVAKLKKFIPKPDYSGKEIFCTLADWQFQDLSISTVKEIKVRGRPNVYGPINPIGGILTKKGLVYAEVIASPEVTSYEWRFRSEKVQENADLKLGKECSVNNDAQTCNFTITYSKVMSSYYGTYTFSATNKFGTSQREIKFLDEKNVSAANRSNKLTPSVIMLISIILFKIFS